MSDKNKNIRNRLADFIRYHRNELSGEERNSFERELQKDPFAEEASEGFASVSQEDALKDISQLQKRIKIRTGLRRRFYIYRIAASLALLLSITTIYIYIGRNKPEKTLADNSIQSNRMEIIKSQPLKQPSATEGIHGEKMLNAEKKAEKVIVQNVNTEAVGNPENIDELPISEAQKNDTVSDFTKDRSNVYPKLQQMAATTSTMVKEKSLSSYNIRGKILSSEDNLPIPGANVYIKGTSKGVITDSEGNFNINLPDSNNRTITANYIGMEPKDFVTKADSVVQVTLDPSVSALSEVVVVGYGVNKKEALREDNPGIQKPPEPVMGKSDYDKYIRNNLHRPDSAAPGQRVVVVVSFLVHTDGSIDSIRIVRSAGKIFSDEAIRVIKSGPAWKPAVDNGKAVEDEVRLRIVFK
jgi:hypothetical protein